MMRYLRLTLGWLLLAAGIVGLFLPLLQGFLLIGIGAAILSKESHRLKSVFDRIREKIQHFLRKLSQQGNR
jgi:uncharacterized membrane protein YbaN (DUF454 family)